MENDMSVTVSISPEIKVLCKLLELTPQQVLETFIADLCSSLGNGGSDERRMAKEYLLRTNAPYNSGFGYEQLEKLVHEFDLLPDDREQVWTDGKWVDDPGPRRLRYKALSDLAAKWKKEPRLAG